MFKAAIIDATYSPDAPSAAHQATTLTLSENNLPTNLLQNELTTGHAEWGWATVWWWNGSPRGYIWPWDSNWQTKFGEKARKELKVSRIYVKVTTARVCFFSSPSGTDLKHFTFGKLNFAKYYLEQNGPRHRKFRRVSMGSPSPQTADYYILAVSSEYASSALR
ncbi:hypothetical protein L211DRAFT_851063 [Terfezia boudieri ATCC MYA-4762]|uniref:Uncharacterized protein n=1 Tax=Terfezia boudieri ATCC MYA-4762 TaxID=1051890 RepID=A0A3N4LMB7_9PEZI|nr:hypothetical protein L211DRAFT_851063 [Terfezia boudieri ATCC MYA-4762]